MSQLLQSSFVSAAAGRFVLLAILFVGLTGPVGWCSQNDARNTHLPIIDSIESNAGFAKLTKSVYENAWRVPKEFTNQKATATVTITVARDGTVLSRRIMKRSGVPAFDKSVEKATARVKTIGRPFPAGDLQTRRTFNVAFNLGDRRPRR